MLIIKWLIRIFGYPAIAVFVLFAMWYEPRRVNPFVFISIMTIVIIVFELIFRLLKRKVD